MRSYREYWLWLGASFLVLAPISAGVAFAYFTKIASYSLFANPWMVATFIFLIWAFACFLGAIKGWPFPPWKKMSFPNLAVEIRGVGNFATSREVMPGFSTPAKIVNFMVSIVNRESEQDASLTARLYARLKPGAWPGVAEAICVEPMFRPDVGVELKELLAPIRVEAGGVVGGSLVFEISGMYWNKLADPFDAEIELEDHVSGKRVRISAAMGRYEKDTLVPSEGGVRFLPEETPSGSPNMEGQSQAEEAPESPDGMVGMTESPDTGNSVGRAQKSEGQTGSV